MSPDPSYLPAFHANAQQLLKRAPRLSKARFIDGMGRCYDMTYNEKKHALEGRPSRGAMSHGEALRLMEDLWEQQVGGAAS